MMVMVMVGGGGCVNLTGGRGVGVALKVGRILIGENLQCAEETYILVYNTWFHYPSLLIHTELIVILFIISCIL